MIRFNPFSPAWLKAALLALLLAALGAACTPLFGGGSRGARQDDTLVFVSTGPTVEAEAFSSQLNIVLDESQSLDTVDVVVAVTNLGPSLLIETADPKARYLPSALVVPHTTTATLEVSAQQVAASAGWAMRITGPVSVRLLAQRKLGSTTLAELPELIRRNTIGRGANLLLQVSEAPDPQQTLTVYRSPGSMTFLALLGTGGPGALTVPIRLAAVGLDFDALAELDTLDLMQKAQALPEGQLIAAAQVIPPTATPAALECPQGQVLVTVELEDGRTTSRCEPLEVTAEPTAEVNLTAPFPAEPNDTPTPAPTATPTASPTPAPPTATPTPTIPPIVYTETFREVDFRLLGTCPSWVHDRYTTRGPDGNTYRTWHPITVPIDPQNPESEFCSFAHEHGDPPHPDAPLPPFGYLAYQAGILELIDVHAGYKVFSHRRGQTTGWGTQEEVPVNPDIDMVFWVHMGTGNRARLTARFHGAGFWSRDAAGNETLVFYFADTGALRDRCEGGTSNARRVASDCDYSNELWDFGVSIAGAWSTPVRVAVLNPMNHMRGDTEEPERLELINTSEAICGVNFFPCAYKLPFGHPSSIWQGNMRMLYTPDWQWNNREGATRICTDVYGNKVDESLCESQARGYLIQQVARINFFGGRSQVWDRSYQALGDLIRLPVGAPGGN